ncbi:hypothetical protein [Desulfonatronovibrio hydrogenovorans]|uniref:hypothetical protein n=1 Tax=Desulfonatronovibrio hydrogenovorans TaxID=53245 RepID=UPI00048AF290|nr:hypothetical protein [Desulfonatronovibrio hydrogenovorans]
MQKIPLNLARPGMVLEKPVLRDNGLVLVAQGTQLSDALLGRLENMGVSTITVEGSPLDLEGGARSVSYEERIESLDHMFRNFRDDPWMIRMKEFIRSYFERKMAAGSSGRDAGTQDDSKDSHPQEQQ